MSIRIRTVGTGITKSREIDLSALTLDEARAGAGAIAGFLLKSADFDEKIRDTEGWALQVLTNKIYVSKLSTAALREIDPSKYKRDSPQWYAATILERIGWIRFCIEDLARLEAGGKSPWPAVHIIRPSSMPPPDPTEEAAERRAIRAEMAICAAIDLGKVIKECTMKLLWEDRALNGVAQEKGREKSRRARSEEKARREQEIRDYYNKLSATHPSSSPKGRLRETIEHFYKDELTKDQTLPEKTRASRVRGRVRKRVARALKKHPRAERP